MFPPITEVFSQNVALTFVVAMRIPEVCNHCIHFTDLNEGCLLRGGVEEGCFVITC